MQILCDARKLGVFPVTFNFLRIMIFKVDKVNINIFNSQNIGSGITFKILISRTVQSRFRKT